MTDFASLLAAIRAVNNRSEGFLPLHAPVFSGNERRYVLDAIDSTFVSSIGEYVGRFEDMLREICGAGHVAACVNGTTALHAALFLAGVSSGDLVPTQALTFAATANAIRHAGGEPVFLDVDADTLGLSPNALRNFLESECERSAGGCRHKTDGKRVAACVPVHTFGFPCRITEICDLCESWGIPVVEDAAEALGSLYRGRHCGTFGLFGIVSFNGNKIVTTGGGGAILTQNAALGKRCKHLTTTAKVPHCWEFRHDEAAWNYRMPNLNAALGCAQLERLSEFVAGKRALAERYAAMFSDTQWKFLQEPGHCASNYWLCAVLSRNRQERDAFLTASNNDDVTTRPVWEPLHTLPMYTGCLHDELCVTHEIAEKLINLPSGYRQKNI
jgi:aminotransferase in exopolysaccharide biosynthesis